jgi:hypothetical protein
LAGKPVGWAFVASLHTAEQLLPRLKFVNAPLQRARQLFDLRQSTVHNVGLRLALVPGKIGQQLFFGFIRIGDKFLPRSES